jgi:UDP-N-acetylmuramoyl-L-alanyl-D-glutamate--2,6-diaminopimelate ligase
MMKLVDLLKDVYTLPLPDCTVRGLHNDSRYIKPGFLFFAYPGVATDGRLFCTEAIAAGAVAVVYEPTQLPALFDVDSSVIYVPIPQLALRLSLIARRFYDDSSCALSVTGVTGTNGKTTIAYQLAQAYALLGKRSAYIGTIGQGEVHALQPIGNTTPDALCLQEFFHQYRQQGIQQVCMEVSSHALVQQRVAGIEFTQAIYTNLSHEHLDYHGTMDAYASAKACLFATETLESAVINYDDAYKDVMLLALPNTCHAITYGFKEGADVRALNVCVSMTGSSFEVSSPWGRHTMHVKALGVFNIYNSLAVFASLMARGYLIQDVIPVMADLLASPGRMERVIQEPCVIVDYAHTPDALENVLQTLVQLKTARLWVVFGCGGDRDRSKRPMMGRIASQYADVVIVTSDNPRSEDPDLILKDIIAGVLPDTDVIQIPDRLCAIHHALEHADKTDIILIAGKGHESYQQIGTMRIHFSDQDVVHQYQLTLSI